MRKILFGLFFLTPLISNCQFKPINFTDCKTDQMFVQAEVEPKWNNDTIGLIDYLNKFISDKNIQQVENGIIVIGILIYPDGKTCCHSFSNMTKVELDAEIYREVINKMPNWTAAIQNEEKITFLKQQVLKIKNGKFIIK